MHKIYSRYLSDPEVASCCSDERFIRHMLDVEIALATVQATLGIIPEVAAQEITEALGTFQPPAEQLSDGTLHNGVPTIPLLALARQQLSVASRDYLHWGATSQDIMDTAQIMMIREVITIFRERTEVVIDALSEQAERYRDLTTVARTRTQQAVPITYGEKIDSWRFPLERHLQRLDELQTSLLCVQLGGAGGNLAALGEQGIATARGLAAELRLSYRAAWHNQRDTLLAFSNWMAALTASLAKMAGDVLLLAQTEVGELLENTEGGGGSSTMPHKNNPILSEAIVALARYAGQLAGANFQTLHHQHERDGSAWILEWLTYPQMIMATGTVLRHAGTIARNMEIQKKAVDANLKASNGLIFSERASFILAQHMPRQEAKQIVGQACELVIKEQIHLSEALTRLVPDISVDW